MVGVGNNEKTDTVNNVSEDEKCTWAEVVKGNTSAHILNQKDTKVGVEKLVKFKEKD